MYAADIGKGESHANTDEVCQYGAALCKEEYTTLINNNTIKLKLIIESCEDP